MAIRLSLSRPHGSRRARLASFWRPLVAIVLLFSSQTLLAETSLEYRVKAAFLYNFTKFVEWPPESYASPDAPLEICVFGSDPFGLTLDDTVRGKSANSHLLSIRRINRQSEMPGCKVIYFGDSEDSRLRSHISELEGLPILTVSDAPDFLELGGMIRFLIIDGKVRFNVNHRLTNMARLTVSSKLLSVANRVVNGSDS